MKATIETLVRAWVKDNRSYIEENYEDIEDWMTDYVGEDNWMYNFFTDEEIDEKSEEEMIDEVYHFASNYRCTPAEFLGEIQDIMKGDEDWKIEESDKGAEFFAYQKMTPNEYIKIVTGKLLIESNADINEIAKAYKSSESKEKEWVYRARVKSYLQECIKLNKEKGE